MCTRNNIEVMTTTNVYIYINVAFKRIVSFYDFIPQANIEYARNKIMKQE